MSEGKFKKPISFSNKDLSIDVELFACYNNKKVDFTGRKTFHTGFFRNNIGFGITDIKIEINPSLQPVVDISFKDLYGNTVSGLQRGYEDSLDTSVLFAWPPPKFVFSFKGFLGRKVTWLLNLKTTNVSYDSSDGSYKIDCSFVPNQWGFLADIPFLYLVATKLLRTEHYAKPLPKPSKGSCASDLNSIFSFIRVGKQIEVKTKAVTKEFDSLKKQLTDIKYNITNAIYKVKNLEYNTPIDGVINGKIVSNFIPLIIKERIPLEEAELIVKKSDTANKFNLFVLMGVKRLPPVDPKNKKQYTVKDGKYIIGNKTRKDKWSDMNKISENSKEWTDMKLMSQQIIKIVDKNIKAVDEQIKKEVYNSSKTQLAKLTIGQVLNQISRDASFILGLILEYGFLGYKENKIARDSAITKLIGKSFPLMIDEKGNEVPALKRGDDSTNNNSIFNPSEARKLDLVKASRGSHLTTYAGTTTASGAGTGIINGTASEDDYGVENYEWRLVNQFISAISKGIAENMPQEGIGEEDNLKQRINNLEILMGNPYKPFYGNIAENLLIRSGIIAFLTRSEDPNLPGDYGSSIMSLYNDDDSLESIISLAKKDMENLSKSVLGQLTFKDTQMLKRFCKFWDKIFTEDGDLALEDGSKDDRSNHIFNGEGHPNQFTEGYNYNVSNELLDLKVSVDDHYFKIDNRNIHLELYYNLVNTDKKNKGLGEADYLTVRKLFKELLKEETDFSKFENEEEHTGFINTAYLDVNPNTGDGTYTATLMKNNGIYYNYPNVDNDEYYYVLFIGDDVNKLKSVHSSDSDGTFDDDEEENDKPKGIIYINKKQENGETLESIENLNGYIENNKVIDYRRITKHKTTSGGSGGTVSDLSQYLWTEKIETAHTQGYPAENLAFMIYSHQFDITTGDSSDLTFGLFCNKADSSSNSRARNQRAALKAMSSVVLSKLNEIESDKNTLIGTIAGKAGEHGNAIYKQMHTIFHQWQTVAGINDDYPCGGVENPKGLAELIESQYGDCKNHIERDLDKKMVDRFKELKTKTIFLYDYPLAPINHQDINIKNSIINIDPIYNATSNANASTLNVIEQVCSKNNFIFVPFPGDPMSDNIEEIYQPYATTPDTQIMNYFHVLFAPTPETRTNLSNDSTTTLTDYLDNMKNKIQTDAILIEFGKTNNQIFKSINVGTDTTKPSVESILNLQRLADKENTNKNVAIDCSTLPIIEGRSYKATINMLGNSQVYPMQYFFINNMPLFGGLYQIMKVTHSISPNNMDTSLEGIRMRFTPAGGFGGIEPITLDSLEALASEKTETIGKIGTESETMHSKEARYAVEQISEGNTFEESPPIPASLLTESNVKKIFSNKGYALYTDKLNIIGIRNKNNINTNRFDDVIMLIWYNNGKTFVRHYRATTKPGSRIKGVKYEKSGIAMMKEGQYVNAYYVGLHHGRYEAMHQQGKIWFYRIKWVETGKPFKLDSNTLEHKVIGANIHRANDNFTSTFVNNWSTGCQVIANPSEFADFISITKTFKNDPNINQRNFTYTLINESDFDGYSPSGMGTILSTVTKKTIANV